MKKSLRSRSTQDYMYLVLAYFFISKHRNLFLGEPLYTRLYAAFELQYYIYLD